MLTVLISVRAVDEYLYGNKVGMVDSRHVEDETGLLLRPQLELQYQPETETQISDYKIKVYML